MFKQLSLGIRLLFLVAILCSSCQQPDQIVESQPKKTALRAPDNELIVVNYNIHGGHGNLDKNIRAFKAMLNGSEQILCFEEVNIGNEEVIKSIFSEYSYSYYTIQKGTKFYWPWETRKKAGNFIISKLPIIQSANEVIQIDPGGDKWERKAQHLTLKLNEQSDEYLELFHYHNTYNWDKDNFKSEKEGMLKFVEFINRRLGENGMQNGKSYVVAGDVNLIGEDAVKAVPAPFVYGRWRDYQYSNRSMIDNYWLKTIEANISDHDAIVVKYQF